jgi:hypothetical protein
MAKQSQPQPETTETTTPLVGQEPTIRIPEFTESRLRLPNLLVQNLGKLTLKFLKLEPIDHDRDLPEFS